MLDKMISIKVDFALKSKVADLAAARRTTESEVVRDLLWLGINQFEDRGTDADVLAEILASVHQIKEQMNVCCPST